MVRIVKWKSRLSTVILIPVALFAIVFSSHLTFLDNWRHWIAVWPLSLFFYLAGAELRWEFREGLFTERGKALVVCGAVLGGMAAPALIYLLGAHLTQAPTRAWGVPMATDLPLVLAVLSFLPNQKMRSLRPFLLALAITDDIGSVLVLSIGFHQAISPSLIAALLGALAPKTLQGFHERLLSPIVNYLVIPIFILSALSIKLNLTWNSAGSKISLSLIAARLIGKPLGIFLGASLVSLIFKIGAPLGRRDLALAGVLASLGLSVSLLFASITLTGADEMNAIIATILSIPVALIASAFAYFFTRETAA
jgi:NhaA family Na+:H+ antiporter